MSLIYCANGEDSLVAVPPENVQFSPAGYGILIENNRVLLLKHPHNGLWFPPGGKVSLGQTPGRAVRTAFWAATGITPQLDTLLSIEQRHHVDHLGKAWCLSVMYYALSRPEASPPINGHKDMSRPEWVPLKNITRDQMYHGYQAIQSARSLLTVA